jgi:hypothetical protein
LIDVNYIAVNVIIAHQLCHQHEKLRQSQTEAEPGIMTFQEIRDRANRVRGIPLQEVLLLAGAKRDRHDKSKWNTAKGAISCTAAKFMNWNQGVGGGGAIDLAMHLNNLGFKAAVEWLCHHFPNLDCRQPLEPTRAAELILPPQDPGKLPAVKRYLTDERAIAPSLIQHLIESGRLYADSRGNAVFLLLGKQNKPVGAELRGISTVRWRGIAPGSQRDLGYFSVPAPDATAVILCESAIDAISCLELHPSCLCASTSGARPNPRWLPWLIRQGCAVYCGFDSDSTGESMASNMIAVHPGIKRLRPSQHDWNDVLKQYRAISPRHF